MNYANDSRIQEQSDLRFSLRAFYVLWLVLFSIVWMTVLTVVLDKDPNWLMVFLWLFLAMATVSLSCLLGIEYKFAPKAFILIRPGTKIITKTDYAQLFICGCFAQFIGYEGFYFISNLHCLLSYIWGGMFFVVAIVFAVCSAVSVDMEIY